jgi:putative membrane protein
MWWHGDLSWWSWLIMSVGMVAFWGLVIWALVALLRGRGDSATPRQGPHEILAERLARGEIDEQEYRERLDALRSPAGRSRTPVQ